MVHSTTVIIYTFAAMLGRVTFFRHGSFERICILSVLVICLHEALNFAGFSTFVISHVLPFPFVFLFTGTNLLHLRHLLQVFGCSFTRMAYIDAHI